MFENEIGKIVVQKNVYEWKPVMYNKCRNSGHEIANCRRQQKKRGRGRQSKEEQIGSWSTKGSNSSAAKAKESTARAIEFNYNK